MVQSALWDLASNFLSTPSERCLNAVINANRSGDAGAPGASGGAVSPCGASIPDRTATAAAALLRAASTVAADIEPSTPSASLRVIMVVDRWSATFPLGHV